MFLTLDRHSYLTVVTAPTTGLNDAVAFSGSGATVMKYNGTSWDNVGPAGFSAGQADDPSLAIDNTGTPFVAFKDTTNSYQVTVMKYAP